MKCPIIARDRTMMLDETMTVREVIDNLKSRGVEISLRRTFQLYGLHYVDDRAFSSKYRQEFNLSSKKTLYDIQLHELKIYKDLLTGHSVRGY